MGFLYSLFCLTSLHTKNDVFKNPRSSTDGVWQHWCEASWSHCQELSHKLCAQLHAESHFANKGWVDDWEFLKMLVPVDFQSCSRKWRSWDWICLEEFCLPHWNQWWSFRGRGVSQLDSCRFWMKSGSSHLLLQRSSAVTQKIPFRKETRSSEPVLNYLSGSGVVLVGKAPTVLLMKVFSWDGTLSSNLKRVSCCSWEHTGFSFLDFLWPFPGLCFIFCVEQRCSGFILTPWEKSRLNSFLFFFFLMKWI